jgi:hypothetical protein
LDNDEEAYMLKRFVIPLTLLTSLLAALALGAVPALAKDGDVLARGTCTGRSTAKLKLSPEDGRIEVEFEVDQNRVGKTWRVKIKRDGNVLASGTRVTQAPSGSFTFRATVSNGAGADTIVGKARNLASGQVCRGVATI